MRQLTHDDPESTSDLTLLIAALPMAVLLAWLIVAVQR
jgi:hypothetical protein